ncbi:phage tail protein [Limosilactobacillus reuteri]|uniref:phage tail protein n=1 Tax=Limosilactobacillus reuteri TaxID=1598 RepID=UPI0023618C6C|nr:phage tail protein [Limosilactobacillus reuteri]MDD1400989.1 phage tail protein [Limosilactobacillus reuteri]
MADEINLDDAINKWIKKVKNASELSEADRLDINMTGADVFEKALRDETNAKHRSTHKDAAWGHAADSIGKYAPKGLSKDYGVKLGSFIVGWKNRYHSMNMLRLNDGTKKIVGDHFVTNLRQNSTVRSEMLKAERERYEEILRKKGDD